MVCALRRHHVARLMCRVADVGWGQISSLRQWPIFQETVVPFIQRDIILQLLSILGRWHSNAYHILKGWGRA